jgi:hypothetical protein
VIMGFSIMDVRMSDILRLCCDVPPFWVLCTYVRVARTRFESCVLVHSNVEEAICIFKVNSEASEIELFETSRRSKTDDDRTVVFERLSNHEVIVPDLSLRPVSRPSRCATNVDGKASVTAKWLHPHVEV